MYGKSAEESYHTTLPYEIHVFAKRSSAENIRVASRAGLDGRDRRGCKHQRHLPQNYIMLTLLTMTDEKIKTRVYSFVDGLDWFCCQRNLLPRALPLIQVQKLTRTGRGVCIRSLTRLFPLHFSFAISLQSRRREKSGSGWCWA